jgi:DNA invertase Pin-like site-specific DNA recombinase
VGEEGLDMSAPMGRMFAGILVQFAEWELQSIGERRRQGQNVLRREARYGGDGGGGFREVGQEHSPRSQRARNTGDAELHGLAGE